MSSGELVGVVALAMTAVNMAWTVHRQNVSERQASAQASAAARDYSDNLRASGIAELQRALDILHSDDMLVLHRLHDTLRIVAYHGPDDPHRLMLARDVSLAIEDDMDRLQGPRLIDPAITGGRRG